MWTHGLPSQVRRLGADHVIGYTTAGISNGSAPYDLAFQLGGTYSPGAIRKVLTPHGTLIQSYGDGSRLSGALGNMINAPVLSLFVCQALKAFNGRETTEVLDEITELIEAGQLTPSSTRPTRCPRPPKPSLWSNKGAPQARSPSSSPSPSPTTSNRRPGSEETSEPPASIPSPCG
ncbi:MAG: zinc-binding dehydrogenase [Dermatophilaceae bacterium]|nr:zinc-binding dehydrogenase [Dermatophilaceae bacterium]